MTVTRKRFSMTSARIQPSRTAAFVALAFASLGAPALAAEGEPDALARYKLTGQQENCLLRRTISTMRVIDRKRILFRAGGAYYVSRVSGNCSGGVRGGRLQYETTSSSLCRGDVIRVFDNLSDIYVGACSLGPFERLEARAPANATGDGR